MERMINDTSHKTSKRNILEKADSMLEVKDLWVKYPGNENWTLKNVDLQINQDKFVLIGGKSGSGKSTLAYCLTGLIPSFYDAQIKGKITISGQNPLKGSKNIFGTVGFVSQQPKNYTVALSVEEEIIFPLENLGLTKEEIFSRLGRVLTRLDIEELSDKPTTEISAGELQKIAIGSALSMKPKFIVLDEPIARLDRFSSLKIARILKQLARNGTTVIVFEHHLDEILPYADRIFLLENGNLNEVKGDEDFVKMFDKVDLPEIAEVFLILKKQGKINSIPINMESALTILKEKGVF